MFIDVNGLRFSVVCQDLPRSWERSKQGPSTDVPAKWLVTCWMVSMVTDTTISTECTAKLERDLRN